MKTLTRYIIGFVLSLILTGLAFGLAAIHLSTGHVFPTDDTLFLVFPILAVLQFLVQIILFLHVGSKENPRWNLTVFFFALIVVTILVGGTLWIMHNLAQGHAGHGDPFIGNEISPQTEND